MGRPAQRQRGNTSRRVSAHVRWGVTTWDQASAEDVPRSCVTYGQTQRGGQAPSGWLWDGGTRAIRGYQAYCITLYAASLTGRSVVLGRRSEAVVRVAVGGGRLAAGLWWKGLPRRTCAVLLSRGGSHSLTAGTCLCGGWGSNIQWMTKPRCLAYRQVADREGGEGGDDPLIPVEVRV